MAQLKVRSLCLLVLLSVGVLARPRVLHQSSSDFGTVRVVEDEGERVLEVEDGGKFVEQSRCRLADPDELIYDYSRVQRLGVLFPPRLERMLVVGLGGGSLSKALAEDSPDAEIVSVELDPQIARLARDYFFYRESAQVRTVVADARAHLEKNPQQYDLIFLDAFSGAEIPPPLRTVEFYELVRQRLRPGGAVVANLIEGSALYPRDLVTLRSVFPVLTGFRSENQNIVVGTMEPVGDEQLKLQASLRPGLGLVELLMARAFVVSVPPGLAPLRDLAEPR